MLISLLFSVFNTYLPVYPCEKFREKCPLNAKHIKLAVFVTSTWCARPNLKLTPKKRGTTPPTPPCRWPNPLALERGKKSSKNLLACCFCWPFYAA